MVLEKNRQSVTTKMRGKRPIVLKVGDLIMVDYKHPYHFYGPGIIERIFTGEDKHDKSYPNQVECEVRFILNSYDMGSHEDIIRIPEQHLVEVNTMFFNFVK